MQRAISHIPYTSIRPRDRLCSVLSFSLQLYCFNKPTWARTQTRFCLSAKNRTRQPQPSSPLSIPETPLPWKPSERRLEGCREWGWRHDVGARESAPKTHTEEEAREREEGERRGTGECGASVQTCRLSALTQSGDSQLRQGQERARKMGKGNCSRCGHTLEFQIYRLTLRCAFKILTLLHLRHINVHTLFVKPTSLLITHIKY